MGRYSIEAATITHIGLAKVNNEDNYYVNGKYKSDSSISTDGIADKKERKSYTYAVCDGMGGASYGELASLIVAATLAKYIETDIRTTLSSYIKTVNEFICDLIRKDKKIKSGSTLALLNIRNNSAIAYNIGDSRVYFCRKGNLYLLTKDHIDPLVPGVLTQYLGMLPDETNITVSVSEEVNIKKDDIFMLCTSGLTEVVDNDEIVEFLSETKDTAASIAKKLVAASQEKNSKNDVTVVVVKVA